MCANTVKALMVKSLSGKNKRQEMSDTDDRINRIETKIDAITDKLNNLQTFQEVTKQLAKHRSNDVKIVIAVSSVINGFLVLFISLHLI